MAILIGVIASAIAVAAFLGESLGFARGDLRRPRADAGVLVLFRHRWPPMPSPPRREIRYPEWTMLTIHDFFGVLLRFGLSGTTGMFFVDGAGGHGYARLFRSPGKPSPI